MCCIWSLGYWVSRLIKFQIKAFHCVLNSVSSNKEVLCDSFTLSSKWRGVSAFGSIRPVARCDAQLEQQPFSNAGALETSYKSVINIVNAYHTVCIPPQDHLNIPIMYCTCIFKKRSLLFCAPHCSSCSFMEEKYTAVMLVTWHCRSNILSFLS